MSEELCGNLEYINSDQGMKQALSEDLLQICEQLALDASVIFLLSGKNLKAIASHGCKAKDVEIGEDSVVFKELQTENTSIRWKRKNHFPDKSLNQVLSHLDIADGILIPLFGNGKLSGIWLLAASTERTVGIIDDWLMHTLTQNIILKINNLLLSKENQHYYHEADTIYKIGTEISQFLDIDRVLKVIVVKACELLNAEISYLALADDDAQMIRVRVTHGTRGDALRTLTHKYGEGVGGNVAVTRTPAIVDNYPNGDWPKPPGISELIASESIISSICVPMCTRRGLVGVLYVASRHEAAFTQAHLNLLQSLGTLAAVAIENARLYDEQKALAESLSASITTNERLLNLVIDNQGLQSIADTLSDLVQCPILVEDSRFRILCSSLHGSPEIERTEIQSFQVSSIEFWKNPGLSESLDLLKKTLHSIRVPGNPQLGQNHSRIIVPIVAGEGLVGYISVLEPRQPLNEQKYSIVEQASIVFALEFVKQEAARANLLHHVITAQDEERKRIARELHDETSQALTALMIGLDTAKIALELNPEEAANRLNTAKAIAEGMLMDIQRLIADLRPSLLDDLGLVPAIAWYGEQRLKPLNIDLSLEGNALEYRLPSSMEAVLFRIFQEAITNIIRHANASIVSVRLDIKDQDLALQITDNGVGFDAQILKSPNSWDKAIGLRGIQERIRILEGEFDLRTAPNQGTTIEVHVPMP